MLFLWPDCEVAALELRLFETRSLGRDDEAVARVAWLKRLIVVPSQLSALLADRLQSPV